MAIDQRTRGFTVFRSRLPVSWMTIAVFATVICYVDGFWVTSLRGAVGAIGSNDQPFMRWLRDSTLMLPLFVLAVMSAMMLTHRWMGHSRRGFVKIVAAGLLTVVVSSGVSLAQVAMNSVHDYRIQASELELSHSSHASTVAAQPGAVALSGNPGCNALCSARHATLETHVRAAGYAAIVLLITNLILVVWVLALRGGRLWAPHVAASGRQADRPDNQTPAGAVLV